MSDPSPWSRPRDDRPADPPAPGEPAAAADAEDPAPPSPGAAPVAEPTVEMAAPPAEPDGIAEPETLSERAEPTPVPNTPEGTAPPSMSGGGASGALIPVLGLGLLVVFALIAALVAYVREDHDSRYPSNLGDGDYDLTAMLLRNRDVPSGMQLAQRAEFNNEEWAQILDENEPDRKQAQLDSQQRVRNAVAYFSWPGQGGAGAHLGQSISITSQSTLYETDDAARDEAKRLCGLYVNENAPLTEFSVPKIGDQSEGFMIVDNDNSFGNIVDTVVCFRTGRILHGIIQTGLEGANDVGLAVRLAQRMAVHVDNTFAHVDDPKDPDPPSGG